MAKNILITGGTGLIGTRLTELLLSRQYKVAHLSRKPAQPGNVPRFHWDIEQNTIDPEALEFADYIVHLAGANIGEKRWTKDRKKVILHSRTDSADLLFRQAKAQKNRVKAFISASGTNIYGQDTGGILLHEERRQYGDDFLATVVKAWEASARQFDQLHIRNISIRTGFVLSANGDSLARMAAPVKLGLGAPLGSGQQFVSWIHIDDLANIYLKCITDDKMEGAYNAVAPNPVTNKEMMREIARVLKRPFFLPNVPGFLLKLVFGELASVVLGGNKVSSEKLEKKGFEFKYTNLEGALKDVLL